VIEGEFQALQKLQNRMMRLILKCRCDTPIRQMLLQLEFLSVRQRITYNTLVLLFKMERGPLHHLGRPKYIVIIQQSIEDYRKTWEVIKENILGSDSRHTIKVISKDGRTVTDPTDMANSFNKYFSGMTESMAQQPTLTQILLTSKIIRDFYTQPRKLMFAQLSKTSKTQHQLDMIV
jgi:hypothetical protein